MGLKGEPCLNRAVNQVQQKIFVYRGLRVILDSDLAKLYGVTTKQLNQQFKRNLSRLPRDFAFQLTAGGSQRRCTLKVTNCDLEPRNQFREDAAGKTRRESRTTSHAFDLAPGPVS